MAKYDHTPLRVVYVLYSIITNKESHDIDIDESMAS